MRLLQILLSHISIKSRTKAYLGLAFKHANFRDTCVQSLPFFQYVRLAQCAIERILEAAGDEYSNAINAIKMFVTAFRISFLDACLKKDGSNISQLAERSRAQVARLKIDTRIQQIINLRKHLDRWPDRVMLDDIGAARSTSILTAVMCGDILSKVVYLLDEASLAMTKFKTALESYQKQEECEVATADSSEYQDCRSLLFELVKALDQLMEVLGFINFREVMASFIFLAEKESIALLADVEECVLHLHKCHRKCCTQRKEGCGAPTSSCSAQTRQS